MKKLEIERIISQIEKLYGNNWPGIDVNQIFSEIDDEMADKKLDLFNNTIHQIARHILATEFVVIKRLQGINHKLKEEEEWIPIDQLKKLKWTDTREEIIDSKKKIIFELTQQCDSNLDNPILEDYSTIYDTIQGHIQHTYYHIGQISIIKKIIEKSNRV